MTTRLVLGGATIGTDVVAGTDDAAGRLMVVARDAARVEALREEGVDAVVGDPIDPATYPPHADLIVVAMADPVAASRVARAAREAFPECYLLAYAGDAPDAETVTALREVADEVVDPVATVASAAVSIAAGADGERVRRLRTVLRSLPEPLAVVTHDNPDPDAIASGLALTRLAEGAGLAADLCYYGEISHQENRALVNLLEIDLRSLSAGDIEKYESVALVDHSRPGVNDSLPEGTSVDVVVDHHPPRGPVEGRFVDLRSEVGATSTLLAEYYDRLGLTPSEQVATALLYGIRVDTRDFTREAAERDFAAVATLLDAADADTLERVERPSVSHETLEITGRSIREREVREGTLTSCVGEISDRDALAQAAEQLLDMEGVNVTVVFGYLDDTVYVSARARGADFDLGETLRAALGRIGSAGGHADMAGAQIPLGILADVGEGGRDDLAEVVRDVVAERVYDALTDAPSPPAPDEDLTFEFPAGVDLAGADADATQDDDREGGSE